MNGVKTQKDTTSHSLGWLKWRQKTSVGNNVEKLETMYWWVFCFVLLFYGGAILENTLAVTQNVKCRLRNPISRYITMRIESTYPCKNLYTNIHSNTVQNNMKWKQPKCCKWLIYKLYPVYPYNGILFGNKKECSINTCYNLAEPWKHAEWKEAKITCCIIPSIWNIQDS